MLKTYLLISAILFFSLTAGAQKASFESHPTSDELPFKSLAIGIASPGPGVSKLGHAFLLFMTTPQRLSESYAVQFNVSDPIGIRDESPEFLKFFGFGKRFSAEATAGLSMMNRYRRENRAVLLFNLKLKPEQLARIWENLRAERIRREENVLTDYNFLTHNCLTEGLRFVNAVLEPGQKKFEYLDSENTFENFEVTYLAMPGLYIKNAPYAIAPKIANHPLVIGKPVVLVPAMIANAKLLVDLEKQTQLFLTVCRYDKIISGRATRIIGQPTIRESQAYLNLLEKIRNNCNSELGQKAYNNVISRLYSLAESPESLMRIERYLQ